VGGGIEWWQWCGRRSGRFVVDDHGHFDREVWRMGECAVLHYRPLSTRVVACTDYAMLGWNCLENHKRRFCA